MEDHQPTADCNAANNHKKKAHVPKFGDWDSENISYTQCFEDARKDGVKRNPNDPQDNPEAFNKAMFDSSSSAQPPKPRRSIDKIAHHQSDVGDRDSSGGHRRRSNEHKISGGSRRTSNTSESSEKSNSEQSLIQQQSRNRREKSDRLRKSFASSGSDQQSMSHHSHSHNSQGKLKSSSGSVPHQPSNLSHDTHTRVSSIPKFGDWDEKDPQSGEGFTYIFEQVKEEKKTASKFPSLPQEASYHLSNASKRGKSYSKSKSWCCLFSSEKM